MRHKCLVIAYGVHESGRREVIGLDVGEAETEAFWASSCAACAHVAWAACACASPMPIKA